MMKSIAKKPSSDHAPKKKNEVTYPVLRNPHTLGLAPQTPIVPLKPLHLVGAGVIQPKLAISQPGDVYEQEADHVADQVMRMPEPALQRTCAPCAAGGAPCLKCAGEKNKMVQRATRNEKPETRNSVVQRSTRNLKPETGNSNTSVPDNFTQSLGSGHPLNASARSFFEPRFGHDFGQVRVHTDAKAAESARSVSALAYTVGRDVVFGAGQYAPGTSQGQRLLAHELTHVVQQGSAGSSSIQRLGDLSQAPTGLICPIATTSPAFRDTDVLFSIESSTLTPTAISNIASFIARWNAAGASKTVRVDGYASTDGGEPLNWTLSCDRALMVEGELMAPSSGTLGIPANFIEMFAQGETSEFSTALAPNRRATISADLMAPPPPTCANPGVSRSLDLQPIFLRTDPADAAPTGTSWTRRFNEANLIWGKLGVTFNELSPVTLDTPLKSTGATVPEVLSIMALRSGTGIEVFLANNDLAALGGGGTTAGCGGGGKVVISDRGTSDTLLAHELSHTLFNTTAHPGDPGTIAIGSGSKDTDNSRRNTMVNFALIVCPAGTGSTCLNPDV